MSKDQTQIIKGIALLFMVWGHLFSNPAVTSSLLSFLNISGVPFSSIVCRGMGPVDFFLVTGGYGLYFVYRKGTDRHHLSRVFRLFIHYWTILILFMPLAIMTGGDFGFSPLQVFYEITGLHTYLGISPLGFYCLMPCFHCHIHGYSE